MGTKSVTLTIADQSLAGTRQYKVVQTKNTLLVKIGDYIEEKTLQHHIINHKEIDWIIKEATKK